MLQPQPCRSRHETTSPGPRITGVPGPMVTRSPLASRITPSLMTPSANRASKACQRRAPGAVTSGPRGPVTGTAGGRPARAGGPAPTPRRPRRHNLPIRTFIGPPSASREECGGPLGGSGSGPASEGSFLLLVLLIPTVPPSNGHEGDDHQQGQAREDDRPDGHLRRSFQSGPGVSPGAPRPYPDLRPLTRGAGPVGGEPPSPAFPPG